MLWKLTNIYWLFIWVFEQRSCGRHLVVRYFTFLGEAFFRSHNNKSFLTTLSQNSIYYTAKLSKYEINTKIVTVINRTVKKPINNLTHPSVTPKWQNNNKTINCLSIYSEESPPEWCPFGSPPNIPEKMFGSVRSLDPQS